MKNLTRILLVVLLSFGLFATNTNASFFDDLLWDSTPKVHIDCGDKECNIDSGIEIVKDSVNDIEKERPFSEYVQDLIRFLLTFVSIIAVAYIIYAWFRIMTWAWDEETLKKQKNTIIYVIIWIVVMWLAYSIVKFVIQVLSS